MRQSRSSVMLLLLLATTLLASAEAKKVSVTVWTNTTDPDFVYPELSTGPYGVLPLQAKPDIGICASGGGLRAAPLVYGWMRAIHQMGLASQARYLSTESGSSWFAAPYTYTKVPASTFFSPYVTPQQLSPTAMYTSLTKGSWGAACTNRSLIPGGIPIPFPGRDWPTNWALNIANIFLKPFGVSNSQSSVSITGTRGGILEKLTKSNPDLTFNVADTNKPYPIILGALYTPDTLHKAHDVDFTPLYYGVPPLSKEGGVPIGGGLVEPLGFNSQPPSAGVVSKDGSKVVGVEAGYPVSLMQSLGISSSAQGLTMPKGALQLFINNVQQLRYWNQHNFKGAWTSFFDGGGTDPTTMTALLRRKVGNVVALLATRTNTDVGYDKFRAQEFGTSGLFGAYPETGPKQYGLAAKDWNEQQQVFKTEKFKEVFDALAALQAQGKPLVFSMELEVLPNQYHAVTGGYTAKILFVFNGKHNAWEAQLPTATQNFINSRRNNDPAKCRNCDSSLFNFPGMFNLATAPSPVVSLLSQQASWQLFDSEGRDKIDAFFKAAGGAGVRT